MDFHAAQQVKTGENLHLGWRHVYWAPVPAGDSGSLAPLLRFIPLCCLWCSQDRPDSGFRVCCEEMGHHREGAAAWALIPGHRSLRSCLSQLLSQAMNRHLKTPRNPWSQEQKGSVLFPSRPLTSFHASCIFQGSTWWDVSRNFP